ncbi:hypothetical protein ACEPAF_7468 [Sanghuangporus sanghuang]
MLASSSKHALNACTRSTLCLRSANLISIWRQSSAAGHTAQRNVASNASLPRRQPKDARGPSRLSAKMYEARQSEPMLKVHRGSRTTELNMAMRNHLARFRADEVINLAAEMKKANTRPDIHTYNSLLGALAADPYTEATWAVYRDMLAMGIRADTNIFNQLLYAHRASDSNEIQKILQEMERHGLQPNAGTYDFFLRYYMDCDNAEMALVKLAEMNEAGFQPSLKTAQALIDRFGQMGHVRLALELADFHEAVTVRRLDSELWVNLLVYCAEELYAHGVLQCWEKVVNELHIRVDEGLCQLVLDTAARHGLPKLASEAIRELEAIKVDFQEHHFTPMLDAFVKKQLLKEAFCILDLMRSAKVNPTIDSAYSILQAVRHDPEAIDAAYTKLEEMHKEGQNIDVIAVNVLVKACGLLNDLQRGVGIYKAMPSLGIQPDAETFEMLLKACRAAQHIELGERLFREMQESGVKPTAKTFEAFISLVLTQTDYENAFFYLEEMKGAGHTPSYPVYEEIVKTCVANGDTRYKLAVEELEQMGYKMSARLRHFINTGGRQWINRLSDDERLPYETRRRMKEAKLLQEEEEEEGEDSAELMK